MFKRLLVEDLQQTLSVISITIFIAVFAINLIRVLRMSRTNVEQLETLPLAPDEHA
jgi:hypothetical protein